MINISKKIILTLFLLLFIYWTNINTFWASTQKSQYISLHPLSSSYDVKKFQEFFKALKIYPGEINWKYSSIKPYIITFQVENEIITNKKEEWAGYVWPKTYKYFNSKYWEKFVKVYNKYFKIKDPLINQEKYFIVSAYYSPLPKQKRYSTWTYSWDIRLNWNWTHWASGVGVHPWFIAAPSSYPFWTKIQLDGLWIWVVEDRWWAIVRKWVRWHDSDRLDIWMGYWDEWLNRALKWWKKKVKWKLLEKETEITIQFNTEYKKYLAIKIKPESNKEDILKIQKLFTNAKLYTWKIDGNYNSIENEIINFQIKHKIIKNKNAYSAGYIWPKTIKKLEEIYPKVFILIVRKKDVNKTVYVKNLNLDKYSIITKYNITTKSKNEIEKFKILLDKKLSSNKIEKDISINKIKWKLEFLIKKTKKQNLKNKLLYLKDIL